MEQTSESILALKQLTIHYKADASRGLAQFGLISQKSLEVNPDLVVRHQNGEITASAATR